MENTGFEANLLCSVCKKIRDDAGKEPGTGEWRTGERYIWRKVGFDDADYIALQVYRANPGGVSNSMSSSRLKVFSSPGSVREATCFLPSFRLKSSSHKTPFTLYKIETA